MKTTTTLRFTLVALCTVFIFSSCKKLKYYEFDDADKAWINVYSKGETIQFVSDTGDVRTYSITSTTRGYRDEGKNYYSVAEATIRPVDSLENRFPGGFNALKDATGFTFEILWVHHPSRTNISKQAPTSLSAGGISYGDVYVSSTPVDLLDSVDNVQTVYYSKSAGFIQFTEYNGQTWSRKN